MMQSFLLLELCNAHFIPFWTWRWGGTSWCDPLLSPAPCQPGNESIVRDDPLHFCECNPRSSTHIRGGRKRGWTVPWTRSVCM